MKARKQLPKGPVFALLGLLALSFFAAFTATPAHATLLFGSPISTGQTSTAANAILNDPSRNSCYFSGYNFIFYSSTGNNSVYTASQNSGGLWQGPTTSMAGSFTTAVYCDISGNVVVISEPHSGSVDHTIRVRTGVLVGGNAGGVVVFNGKTNFNTTNPYSAGGILMPYMVISSGVTYVYVSVTTSLGTEVWQTNNPSVQGSNWVKLYSSTLSNNGFWAASLNNDLQVVINATSKVDLVYSTNGGTTWFTQHTPFGTNNFVDCDTLSSTTKFYCVVAETNHAYYFTFNTATPTEPTLSAVFTGGAGTGPVSITSDAGNYLAILISDGAGGVTYSYADSADSGVTWVLHSLIAPIPANTARQNTVQFLAGNNGQIALLIGGGSPWTVEMLPFGTGLGTTTTTTTTTNNTGCVGPGCSGGNNGTSTYFSTSMPRLFVFVSSQNTLSPGQIDNFTMKVKAVHITQNVGLVYVLTYEPATPTLPASAGNPWTLLTGNGIDSIQLTNSTSNFFIHANPQTNICTSCYYAVGLMALTTASRGSGATGSGISFYESSQVGQTQYNYDMGSTTPAATFYSNAINHPNFFMFVHETYTVATFSTTVTSTTSIFANSTVLTTSTVTSTATTIDSSFFLQNANYPLIILVLFLPTGLFLGVTKSMDGAIVGLMIGAVILIVLIPELRWIFTGVVITMVALAFLVRRGG